ncbi:non-ribosomal peptide synthetase, partial [Bacillus thuringiensis]|uniref:non-ribosomal peptide synthetase n=1 Tax=Bacillus thuringiensis TaxID=1428 RepID=UPI00115511B4
MLFKGSSFQEKMWLDDEVERGSLYPEGPTYYNIPLLFQIEGELSIPLLTKTLNVLGEKHEVLRTMLLKKDGEVMQCIQDEINFNVRQEDWSNYCRTSEEAITFLKEENNRAFAEKLSESLLCQGIYLKLNESCSFFLLTIHNSLCDEVSKKILSNDIIQIYNCYEKGENFNYTEPPLQYVDFSEWQNELSDELIEDEVLYWKRKLQSEFQPLSLPTDRDREKNNKYVSGEYSVTLEKGLVESMNKIHLQYGYELREIFIAALQILFSAYSREAELILGTCISERMDNLEDTVGPIANVVVLKNKLTEDSVFIEVIEQVKNTYLEAEAHSRIPMDRLITELQWDDKIDRYDLCRVLFNYICSKQSNHATKFREIKLNLGWGKYDYNWMIEETDSNIDLYLTYNAYIYNASMVEQLVQSFITICEKLLASPEQQIKEIDLISDLEKEKILGEFNDTTIVYPEDMNVVKQFEEQAMRVPDKIAVRTESGEITYRELNEKANQLAVRLREMGIGREDYVAIMAERSLETIIGICGIIKAGGVYVPIDPAYPQERITYMLEDCKPKAILVSGASCSYEAHIPIVDLSEAAQWIGKVDNPMNVTTSSDLIYLIYTSGTTGKPKGVMTEHKGVTRLVRQTNYVELNEHTVILQTGSLSFDAATFEIWGALLNGGELQIGSPDVIMDAIALKNVIAEQKVTMMWLTVTLFNQLINEDATVFDQLEKLLIGGEKVSEAHIRKLQEKNKKIQLINGYGPTETTTFAATYCLSSEDMRERTPVGKPITNTKMYIINENKLCGIGMMGELCITGDGVARGYLNNPELTAAKFIPNPYGEGMMYRSGDLARWLPDGNVEYLGRMDEQIKLRGFRIELGEIESVIKQIEGLKDAAVIVSEKDGEKSICAYLVAEDVIDIEWIREELTQKLPTYMIPSHMMQIERVPVTRNGKLDKAALPTIEVNGGDEYIAPRNQTEEKIVSAFERVLGIEKVGIKDNFFRIGGHSLKATWVINQIEEATGVRVSLSEMFSNPTVEGLAQKIKSHECKYNPIPQAQSEEMYPMSSVQKRIFAICSGTNTVSYNINWGIETNRKLDLNKVNEVFNQLLTQHDMLRTQFLMRDGEAYQKIITDIQVKAEYDEVEEANEEDKKRLLMEFIRPFDLETAPLLRIKVIKVNQGTDLLFFDMHHIISDGLSTNIIIEDFKKLYASKMLAPLQVQYKDYSEWMRTRDLTDQREYWRNELQHIPSSLELPLDYPRSQFQSFRGHNVVHSIKPEIKESIATLCKQTGTTEYMVLLSAFMILLSKYSKQEDIVVGSPFSGRVHPDTEKILGMFVNTLVMRGAPQGDKSFNTFLQEMKEKCLMAQANQEYPFEELVEELNLVRDSSRNPLFDVVFS